MALPLAGLWRSLFATIFVVALAAPLPVSAQNAGPVVPLCNGTPCFTSGNPGAVTATIPASTTVYVAPSGGNGVDYSANAPSLAGLSLLATIPAGTALAPRLGYYIEAQCTAGLTAVMDDSGGLLTPTILVLAGPGSNGGQGASLSMSGMPHTGRIRIYSSAAGCQMAARAW